MNQETFNKIKTKFQEGYFKKIKPNLDRYEQKRLSHLKTCKQVVLPILIVIVAFVFFIQIANGKQPVEGEHVQLNLGVIFFAIIVYFVIKASLELTLQCEIKKEVMPIICSCFDELEWNCERYENYREFHEIGLVNYYNRESFDDKFYGNYNNTNFEIIEADLDYESGSGKNRHRRNIFKGVILKFYMNNRFKTYTLIRPDGLFKMPIKNLKRTELEDVVFENKYDVYTDNEIESRVLITTSFMERLNNIGSLFEAKKTYVAFYENKLYVGLHTGKDMFKICSLSEPINSAKYFLKIFEEIIAIYRLIDYLKLIK